MTAGFGPSGERIAPHAWTSIRTATRSAATIREVADDLGDFIRSIAPFSFDTHINEMKMNVCACALSRVELISYSKA